MWIHPPLVGKDLGYIVEYLSTFCASQIEGLLLLKNVYHMGFAVSQGCRVSRIGFRDVTWYVRKGFPGGSVVKNLPAKQEMRVQFLSQKEPLEKETATRSNILAWEIPWTEESDRAVQKRWTGLSD